MKTIIPFLGLIFIFSCRRDAREPIPPFGVNLSTVVFRDSTNLTRSYRYVHGLGMVDSIKMVDRRMKHQTYYWADSFFYDLPLNYNTDSAYFVLHADNNITDTVGFTYYRHYYTSRSSNTYRFEARDLRLSFLSARFLKDSCSLTDDMYSDINLRLILKP